MTEETRGLTRQEVEHVMRLVNDATFDCVELDTEGFELTVAREVALVRS